MAIRFLTILLSTFFLTSFVYAQEHVVVRSDWKKFFSDLRAEGAIVIADERQAEHALSVFGQERAAKRYSPASTFKIPHTLFALDADAVRDEFQVFRMSADLLTVLHGGRDSILGRCFDRFFDVFGITLEKKVE